MCLFSFAREAEHAPSDHSMTYRTIIGIQPYHQVLCVRRDDARVSPVQSIEYCIFSVKCKIKTVVSFLYISV
jgi:hypothetical protein